MNYKKEFEKLFKQTAPYHHRYKVWDDFVTCYALALHNSVNFDQELEDKYLKIINQYEKEDRFNLQRLGGLLVEIYEQEGFCDVLGELYMSLELSSKSLGQFFTPYQLSKLMAKMTFNADALESQEFITISEPACGSGGMMIALAEEIKEQGYNPQTQSLFYCVDVDQTAAMMCYIQLSLFGLPAKVTIGNTLTMQFSRTMCTPMYHLRGWAAIEIIGPRVFEVDPS
ncbi:possible type I restriction enzyme M subunit [Vibrio sp. JCM 19236]|nr:possible type I restriction enzyme M subunit [Vibrio sp. JCM 19236]